MVEPNQAFLWHCRLCREREEANFEVVQKNVPLFISHRVIALHKHCVLSKWNQTAKSDSLLETEQLVVRGSNTMVVCTDSPDSPEMIEKSQVVLPSSPPPRSPNMSSKNSKKQPAVRSKPRRSSGSKPPLAPPPPPAAVQEQESPPSQLHTLGSSEDLSFADFSNFEEEEQQQFGASLSGFLEDDGNKSSSPSAFRGGGRRSKVAATDVASVGNASDTQISVHNMSGRDLHERAKMAFNAGDYTAALPMFESILSAQVRRFSPLHPSVGAGKFGPILLALYTGITYQQT